MSQQTASKKTAAEISSFLNTLGIPIEVRDLTPVTRKRTERSPRGVRKSLDMSDVPPSPDVTDPPIAKKSKKIHNEIEESVSSPSKQKEKNDKRKDKETREKVDKQAMPPPPQPPSPSPSPPASPALNMTHSPQPQNISPPKRIPPQLPKKMPPPLPPIEMPPSSSPENVTPPTPPNDIPPPKKIPPLITALKTNLSSSSEMMPPPPPRQNMHTDNVSISSRTVKRKSSSEYFLNHPGFPNGWTDEMKKYYGSFRGKNYNEKDVYKRQPNSRHLWKTPMDMFQRKRGHAVRCSICHQHGHVNRNCPDKYKPLCCFMCGGKGHSQDSAGRNSCPETCCLNCGLQREKFSSGCSQCLYRRQPLRCHLCGVSGHSQDSCPDNWRRYHSVTSPLPNGAEEILTSISVTQYKRSHELFCCNCASPGHNYYDCNAPRYKNNPFHRNKSHIVKEVDMNSIIGHFGHQTSQTTLPISTVVTPENQSQTPIASSSRTVVLNRNSSEKAKEQSEVIRIQIQNELIDVEENENSPVEKDLSHVASSFDTEENADQCTQHPDCSNKTTRLQVCHHIAVNGYQQSLLLKAKDAGVIRPIEKLCQVNISILCQVLQVHISGENWKAAENELYEILFTKAKEEQMARDNVAAKGSSVSAETTRKVVNDGDNISVVISKPLFLNKPFVSVMPAIPALPLVPSMDVDERFASAQDLITNIPIMRPDGPFAPGQYVPYSILPTVSPVLIPACSTMSVPVPSQPQNLIRSISATIETLKNKSLSSEKPSTSPAVILNTATNKKTTTSEIVSNSNAKFAEITTIEDSDDEIVILEEIQEPPKKIRKVLKKLPLKGEEGLNVFLLPSEWDVVFADSIKKDGILQKIARLFEVTIFVSKEQNTCTISQGSSFDRQKAKEKVTLWLGCHAAKTSFVLNTPEDNSTNVTPQVDALIPSSQDHNVEQKLSRRERRSLGSPRSKGGSNPRRGGSPLRRYNPVPNTNSSVLSSSGHRNFDEKGNNQKSPRFSRPFKGQGVSRGTSNKPQAESSKRRFRYFN